MKLPIVFVSHKPTPEVDLSGETDCPTCGRAGSLYDLGRRAGEVILEYAPAVYYYGLRDAICAYEHGSAHGD